MHDLKLFKYLAVLIALPVGLAFFGGDKFRYPCQDPANWDKAECKPPLCTVNKTCPADLNSNLQDSQNTTKGTTNG